MKKNRTYGLIENIGLLKMIKIMRFTIFILFLSLSQAFAVDSYSQQTKLSLDLKNARVEDIIDKIEKNSEFFFMYNKNMIDVDRKVDIQVEEKNVNEVLDKIFANTGITYSIKDRQILLINNRMADTSNESIIQQQKSVFGKVTDNSGAGLPGVSVVVKGTTTGVITDGDGRYSLLKVPENATLVFSFVGMKSQEIPVNGKSSINITMQDEAIGIEEVVAVGYGTQKKINLTGSIASINMDDVAKNRPITTISDALVGTVPGLRLSNNSGEPGANFSLILRGRTSINGGGPLVLVDNVPMDYNSLNPNDIENVTILKDAAASAIYGSRAAFGVILITTKKPTNNQKNTFNYSNNFVFTSPQRSPNVASAKQTVQAYKDQGWGLTEPYWLGQNLDTWIDLIGKYNADPTGYPNGSALGNDGKTYPLKSNNPYKEMLDNFGFKQNHDISASGSSDKLSYRLSGSLLDEDGILYTNKDNFSRYNISSYISSNVTNWMTTQLTALYSLTKQSNPYTTKSGSLDIWQAASYFPSWYPNGSGEFGGKTYEYESPKAMLGATVPEKQIRDRINVLGKIIIRPIKGLTITGEYLFNKYSDNIETFDKVITFLDGMNYTPKYSSVYDTYQKAFASTTHKALNAYATYEPDFLNNHKLKIMAGYNQEYDFYEGLTTSRTNMINPELPSISGSSGIIAASDNFTEYALRGSFFRVNYSYKDRYLFETNGRYDGSSKFPKNNRFGFFPSVSVGWRVSEEKFMKNIKSVVNNLKIRGSWGSIGNQSINPYLYIATMTPSQVNWVVNDLKQTSLSTPSLVRANFTWEKAITKNIGVDLGLFGDKMNIVFDKYWRETKDMLGPSVDYPAIMGASAPLQNSANLMTKGSELSISWRNNIGKINYGIAFNISDSQTKITKFKNDTKILSSHYEGEVLGEIWGYETDRLYSVDDFIEGTLKTNSSGILAGGTLKPGIAKVEGTFPNPGDVLYKNPDANGLIRNGKNTLEDHSSLRIIGNNEPRYLYGLNGDLSWKGITFSFLIQGVAKRDLWLPTDNNLMWPLSQSQLTSLYTNELDYWTPTNPQAYQARFYVRNSINTSTNRLVQTRYLQNASYLDIKNVTLTYKFPKNLIKGVGFDDLAVFIGCENLWSFNHLPNGLHPESVIRSGGTVYPVMRMISTGINLTF